MIIIRITNYLSVFICLLISLVVMTLNCRAQTIKNNKSIKIKEKRQFSCNANRNSIGELERIEKYDEKGKIFESIKYDQLDSNDISNTFSAVRIHKCTKYYQENNLILDTTFVFTNDSLEYLQVNNYQYDSINRLLQINSNIIGSYNEITFLIYEKDLLVEKMIIKSYTSSNSKNDSSKYKYKYDSLSNLLSEDVDMVVWGKRFQSRIEYMDRKSYKQEIHYLQDDKYPVKTVLKKYNKNNNIIKSHEIKMFWNMINTTTIYQYFENGLISSIEEISESNYCDNKSEKKLICFEYIYY